MGKQVFPRGFQGDQQLFRIGIHLKQQYIETLTIVSKGGDVLDISLSLLRTIGEFLRFSTSM